MNSVAVQTDLLNTSLMDQNRGKNLPVFSM